MQDAAPGRIGVRTVEGAAEFYNRATGERFVPRGFNYFLWGRAGKGIGNVLFALDHFDPAQVEADFAQMAAAGYNTARIFFDQCNDSPNCIAQTGQRGLNGAYLDNMAAVMRIAAEQGIYLMLTSNDLPDGGGYWDLSNQGANAQFEGYRNAHYLTGPGVRAAELYWDDLLSGLTEHDAPFEAVLGWALLNEQWFFEDQPPLSLTSGTVTTANGQSYDLAEPDQKQAMLAEGVRFYIDQVAAVVRQHDPEGLVTMGFFQPSWPNPTRIGQGWYVDTAALLANSALDFFDFHAYPTGELTLQQYAENFGLIGADGTIYTAKPVVMGEVGAFHFAYPSEDAAARAVQGWIADSCAYGWDGWLYWTQVGAPQSVGDSTWGALDNTGLIFDSLAPANQPDPCQTTAIPSPNLALERPVTASAALAEEPASNVTDGTGAQWGAGTDAPQWVAIQLAEPATVGEVRLTVAQWPAGETLHQVWVTRADGREMLLVTFAGPTAEGDTLVYSLPAPLPDVIGLRVETLRSPSWVAWKEIEVMRSTEDGPALCVVLAPGGANCAAGRAPRMRWPDRSRPVAGPLSTAKRPARTASRGGTWRAIRPRPSGCVPTWFKRARPARQCRSDPQPGLEPGEGRRLHLHIKLVRAGVELPAIGVGLAHGLVMVRQPRVGGLHPFQGK